MSDNPYQSPESIEPGHASGGGAWWRATAVFLADSPGLRYGYCAGGGRYWRALLVYSAHDWRRGAGATCGERSADVEASSFLGRIHGKIRSNSGPNFLAVEVGHGELQHVFAGVDPLGEREFVTDEEVSPGVAAVFLVGAELVVGYPLAAAVKDLITAPAMPCESLAASPWRRNCRPRRRAAPSCPGLKSYLSNGR